MELNNDSTTVKVPSDIKEAIENYKNQATLLGLEVNRLHKLKAQIEISVSNLTSAEVSKIEKNRQYQEKIDKQIEQINEFEQKKDSILKERLDFDQKKFEENKKIDEREASVRSKEIEINNKMQSLNSLQKKLEIVSETNKVELSVIENKKSVLKELLAKL